MNIRGNAKEGEGDCKRKRTEENRLAWEAKTWGVTHANLPPRHRYEFYYDVILVGQYTFEIKRMHEKYGPIIRITPSELHISQPDFYDEIYAGGGRRRDKWERFTRQFGIPESVFTTVSHEKHRMRRSALNPFFSMGSVRRLQPMIEERLDAFLKRFAEFQESGEPMVLSLGYAAFTNGRLNLYPISLVLAC